LRPYVFYVVNVAFGSPTLSGTLGSKLKTDQQLGEMENVQTKCADPKDS